SEGLCIHKATCLLLESGAKVCGVDAMTYCEHYPRVACIPVLQDERGALDQEERTLHGNLTQAERKYERDRASAEAGTGRSYPTLAQREAQERGEHQARERELPRVTLSLRPSVPVYVCLI